MAACFEGKKNKGAHIYEKEQGRRQNRTKELKKGEEDWLKKLKKAPHLFFGGGAPFFSPHT
jgi:hypothetical protein